MKSIMNISIYEYLVSFFWFRKKFLLVVVFYWKMLLWVVTRINKLLLWVLSKNQSAFPGYLICFNGTALMKKCILTINILQFIHFVVNYFVPYDKWSGIHPCTGEHHMFCTHKQSTFSLYCSGEYIYVLISWGQIPFWFICQRA